MGTTLTGTTPQDTYDSLIKVTDNGPIGATAKYLSDGLGNDSILALSTAGVGIGTTSVNQELEISQTLDPTIRLTSTQTSSGSVGSSTGRIEFFGSSTAGSGAGIKAAIDTAATTTTRRDFDLIFKTGSNIGGGEPSESMRITSSGNVGIGTSSPSSTFKLTVNSGSNVNSFLKGDKISFSRTSDNAPDVAYLSRTNDLGANGTANIHGYDGIQFRTEGPESVKATITSAGVLQLTQGQIKFPVTQVASADPNTLDDYEEGTWTMGISFGGASVGVTTDLNTGTYTKIGRQVTVNGFIRLTSKGSSTGVATLEGLPFTITNNNANYSSVNYWLLNVSFANQFQGNGTINTTRLSFDETTEAGVTSAMDDTNFANNSGVIVSFTYFV